MSVTELHTEKRLTAEEALEYAQRQKFNEVVILGFYEHTGPHILSSSMSTRDLLWYLEVAKKDILKDIL